jgi:WXXGXW repeat (2 copies)
VSSKASSLIVLAVASILLMFGLAGCKKNDTQDASAQSQAAQTDNLAPTDGTQAASTNDQQQPANQATQQNYQQPAPAQQDSQNRNYSYDEPKRHHRDRRESHARYYPNDESNANYQDSQYDPNDDYQDTSYGQPVLLAQQPPPELPEYSQPECPGDGYLWTPGYWSYAPQCYYWVPGAWVLPPEVGDLWTPGYWGQYDGRYRYHYGFWGQYIGYYGGINYGFGYGGTGYQGGYWSGRRFNYNRSVNNVNRSILAILRTSGMRSLRVCFEMSEAYKTKAMLSAMVKCGQSARSWKTKPIFLL